MGNEPDLPVAARLEPGAGTPARARRAEDAAVVLFGTGTGPGEAGIAVELGNFRPAPEQLENAAFLIDLGAGGALVVPAADAQLLPRGEGGAELRARAAALTEALRRERDWVRRRLQMPDHLLAYAERLHRATTEADIYEALRQVTTPVVGGHTAIVFVGVLEGSGARFHPLADASLRLALDPLPAATATLFAEQRLVTDTDIDAQPDGPLAPLALVLQAAAATQLLCAPVAGEALLLLAERRRQRVLTGEDRDLLQALIRQAEAALRRVVSERRAASLAR